MQTTTLSEIAAILARSERILVFTHISPDGDAIGSLLGLGWLLRRAGKSPALVCADRSIPPELMQLPGADTILTDAPDGTWDVVVGLDASDPQRLGKAFRPQSYGTAPVVILDHHTTNLNFGTHNWVEPTAAATAQVLVHLADVWPLPIDREAAYCLLAGLVTDTRGFRTSNTTPDVLATALRLVECGADLPEITQRILDYQPFSTIRIWGLALSSAQLDGGVAWCHVTQDMVKAAAAGEDAASGLASFLLSAPEANVSAVFTEKANGEVEISFRSRPGYDVARVALSLGGGGHVQAAGCTIPGPLAEAEQRVLALLAAIPSTAG